MRDMVELERKGIPTVAISEDAFENAARNQARMLGMSSLPIVVLPRAKSGETQEDFRQKVDRIFDRMISLVTKPSGGRAMS